MGNVIASMIEWMQHGANDGVGSRYEYEESDGLAYGAYGAIEEHFKAASRTELSPLQLHDSGSDRPENTTTRWGVLSRTYNEDKVRGNWDWIGWFKSFGDDDTDLAYGIEGDPSSDSEWPDSDSIHVGRGAPSPPIPDDTRHQSRPIRSKSFRKRAGKLKLRGAIEDGVLGRILRGISERTESYKAAQSLYRHERLSTSELDISTKRRGLQLLQVPPPFNEVVEATNLATESTFAVEHGFAAEVWGRIRPSNSHTCSYCQKLCIHASITVPDEANLCRVMSTAEIAKASNSGCVVFLWLRQILERNGDFQNVEKRYFTLSLVRGERIDEVNVESNDHHELDHVYHGRLGCFMDDARYRRGKDLGDADTRRIPLNCDVSSEESLRHSRDWLSECHEFHSVCRGSNRSKLPSRVLDVHDGVRLVETGREYDGKYAVLSYCWGGSQPVVSTVKTLAEWKKAIPFNNLPQTIKDAIITTRGLGLQYLWIDSLCIIQDDLEDQMREIPLMSEIYQGAYVTISAASASNCREGFLHRRTPELASVPFLYTDGRLGALSLFKEFGVADEPIHKRAWTLQEHVLSCRILEYGTQQLRRVCKGDPANAGISILDQYDPTRFDTFPQTTEYTLKHFWRPLVHMFMSRDITNPSDRPLAVEGIATEYAKLMKSPCLAGLWGRKDLIKRELLWQTDVIRAHVAQRANSTVPSWSWLAVEGATVKWSDWPSDYNDKTVEVLNCSPHPYMGYASRGPSFLKMQGYLRKAIWDRARRCLVGAEDLSREPIAHIAADATGGGIESDTYIEVDTLEILRSQEGTAVVGLVLLRHEGAMVYRRAGLFWTSETFTRKNRERWFASSRGHSILLI